ncbi:MAG TPA: class I SAM-dependent methyltransferase [Puia sp.]
MTIQQALDLISPAALYFQPDQTRTVGAITRQWADLGCGSGLFTTALAQVLPEGSTVYGVDTNPTVRRQDSSSDRPASIIPIRADFVKDPLELPKLHGILMANSLHYVKDKPALIKKLRSYMQEESLFLIVEYDTDKPVPTWVPYPISYDSLTRLFKDYTTQKLGQRPSAYGRANMYAALVRPR